MQVARCSTLLFSLAFNSSNHAVGCLPTSRRLARELSICTVRLETSGLCWRRARSKAVKRLRTRTGPEAVPNRNWFRLKGIHGNYGPLSNERNLYKQSEVLILAYGVHRF